MGQPNFPSSPSTILQQWVSQLTYLRISIISTQKKIACNIETTPVKFYAKLAGVVLIYGKYRCCKICKNIVESKMIIWKLKRDIYNGR
jgi:hypothetical protein